MTAHARIRGVVGAFANYPATAPEILEDLNTAFSEFRTRHDRRQKQIETEIDNINSTVAALRMNGGGPASQAPSAAAQREFHAELGAFIRDRAAAATAEFRPRAAMSTDSSPDGGYAVTPVMSDQIQRKVFDVSPIARLARRVEITAGDSFQEPFDPSDIGAEWVGERQSRPATTTSQLEFMTVPVREIYTHQPVTQRLLDDSKFDIGGWLNGKISDKFARSEGAAFVSGDGVLRPRGMLTYNTSTSGDSTRDWGKIQYVASGVAAAISDGSNNGVDAILNLVYSLRAPYRPNARFLMNLATAGVVRKLKDDDGHYLWGNARDGQPATLAGFPIELDEEMPSIGANTFPIAFGDIQQAYIVVEKPGIRMLRDPYTDRPNVIFYAYRRIGGGMQNFEAVKLLKIATS